MNVGIIGYGTVGSGVGELLTNIEYINVLKICSREKKYLEGATFEPDYNKIIMDDNIDLIVETIGGTKVAHDVICKSLKNHKHVVTANKDLVSLYMDEYLKLAKENNVNFLFEASVGGGIPIIKTICNLKKFANIDHIYGIINGTTNYILTEMQNTNITLEDSLKEAQRKGYAESNPNADLEGLDMVRKIAILTMLANDIKINLKDVIHYPITGITKDFIDYLIKNDLVVKYVADAQKNIEGFQIVVEPIVVHKNDFLATVNDAYNCIVVNSKENGKIIINGLGAGKYATACSVVNDIINIYENMNYLNYSNRENVVVNRIETANNYLVIKSNGEITIKKKVYRKDLCNYKFYARLM